MLRAQTQQGNGGIKMRKNKLVTRVFAGMMVTALVLQSTPMAPVSAQAAQKKVVIKTQKQLDAALKNKNVTAIEVRTTSGTTFTIKRGDYDKSIVVNSTNAKVVNNGEFKSVTVKNATSFTEKADNNKINVTDKNLNLTVSKGADNSKITVSSTGGKVNVKADGKVATVTVNKKTTLKVSGSTPKAVKIISNAAGASINVASKANVQLNKSSVVNVTKGGQVGVVNAKANANVNVAEGAKVTNVNTYGEDSKVNVKADGTVAKVNVNKKATVNVKGDTETAVKVTSKAEDATFVIDAKSDLVLTEKANVTVTEGTVIGTLVADKDANITVAAGATVDKVEVKGTDAKVNLEANGTVGTVSVDAKADVAVTGSTTSTVKVEANTEGASITTSVKTEVKANANVDVTVEKGAEGSKVTAGKEDVTPTVSNKSDQAVTITDSKGTETKVEVGESTKPAEPEKPTEPEKPVVPPVIPGGGGGYIPSTPSYTATVESATDDTTTTIKVKTTVTGLETTAPETGSKYFEIKKADGSVIEISNVATTDGGYTFTVENLADGNYTLTIKGNGTYKDTTIPFVKDTLGPVISESTQETTVYKSDLTNWTSENLTATDAVDGIVAVTKTYNEETEQGTALVDEAAAKAYLNTVSQDNDKKVVVTYTAIDSGKHTTTKTITYTAKADVELSAVSIAETTAKVGETLTATVTGGGGLSYQWKICDTSDGTYTDITGATTSSYVIKADDIGKYIKVAVSQQSGEPKLSDAKQVQKGDVTITPAKIETAQEVGTTLADALLSGFVAKDAQGNPVAGTFAWVGDSANVVSKTMAYKYTFKPTNTGAYNTPTTQEVNVTAKQKAPTQEEVQAVAFAEDKSTVEYGMLAFKEAKATLEYKVGTNGTWADVTTTAFDANVGEVLYFRTKATNEITASDVSTATKTVQSGDLGTKQTALSAPSIANVTLAKGTSGYTLTLDITDDSNATENVAGYGISVINSDSKEVATGTATAKGTGKEVTLTVLGSTLAAGEYTVKVTAKANLNTKYKDSTAVEQTGVALKEKVAAPTSVKIYDLFFTGNTAQGNYVIDNGAGKTLLLTIYEVGDNNQLIAIKKDVEVSLESDANHGLDIDGISLTAGKNYKLAAKTKGEAPNMLDSEEVISEQSVQAIECFENAEALENLKRTQIAIKPVEQTITLPTAVFTRTDVLTYTINVSKYDDHLNTTTIATATVNNATVANVGQSDDITVNLTLEDKEVLEEYTNYKVTITAALTNQDNDSKYKVSVDKYVEVISWGTGSATLTLEEGKELAKGSQLTVEFPTDEEEPTYAWYRLVEAYSTSMNLKEKTPISDQNAATYTLTAEDEGKFIIAVITKKNGETVVAKLAEDIAVLESFNFGESDASLTNEGNTYTATKPQSKFDWLTYTYTFYYGDSASETDVKNLTRIESTDTNVDLSDNTLTLKTNELNGKHIYVVISADGYQSKLLEATGTATYNATT